MQRSAKFSSCVMLCGIVRRRYSRRYSTTRRSAANRRRLGSSERKFRRRRSWRVDVCRQCMHLDLAPRMFAEDFNGSHFVFHPPSTNP